MHPAISPTKSQLRFHNRIKSAKIKLKKSVEDYRKKNQSRDWVFLNKRQKINRTKVRGIIIYGSFPGPHMKNKFYTAKRVILQVAQKHGLTFEEIKGRSKKRKYVRARMEICYRLRIETDMSLTQIGREIGGRDHTTILHLIKKAKKELNNEY